MPISPYLANVMLSDFDKKIGEYGISMVRYADDLIAFGESEQECEGIHELCVSLLAKEGLSIHPLGKDSKTVICAPHKIVEFLGLGLTGPNKGCQIIVTNNQLAAIKKKILDYSDLDFCLRNGVTLSKLLGFIERSVAGYASAYDLCRNSEQLAHTLSSAKSKALTQLFTQRLGIEYKRLTKKQRIFLEIE